MSEIKTSTWPFPNGKKWEEDLKRQLTKYFKDKRKAVLARQPYIIKKTFDTDWHENIILERVWQHIEGQRKERYENKQSFALHKYIHHGLSSQAFLFNLLGPLVIDKQWHIFDEILSQAGIRLSTAVTNAKFELEDREVFNERKPQPTSIDLCLYAGDVEKVFIEFKFTEKNFGGCSVFSYGDCDGRNPANNFDLCYLHKIEKRKYWELMKKHGLLTEQMERDSQCPFSTLYQLYRLILFALEKNGHFLLIYDERNPSFLLERGNIKRGLFNRVYDSLPADIQSKCHALSVQSILPIFQRHPELDWTTELKQKYFGEMQ
jgi:hypothetical protein